jgi:hypothetical protein
MVLADPVLDLIRFALSTNYDRPINAGDKR